jgi:hypothetical protein
VPDGTRGHRGHTRRPAAVIATWTPTSRARWRASGRGTATMEIPSATPREAGDAGGSGEWCGGQLQPSRWPPFGADTCSARPSAPVRKDSFTRLCTAFRPTSRGGWASSDAVSAQTEEGTIGATGLTLLTRAAASLPGSVGRGGALESTEVGPVDPSNLDVQWSRFPLEITTSGAEVTSPVRTKEMMLDKSCGDVQGR